MRSVSELISLLNKFPHIQKKLTTEWGSQSCKDYLVSLILTDRNDRRGFADGDIEIIDELKERHDEFYPQFNIIDMWEIHNLMKK